MRVEPFAIDRDGTVPAYRQIYDRVRAGIAAGRLAPGARLPSARGFADELGTARGTVDTAYEMLAGEGWIVARGAAGTVVAPLPRLAGGTAAAAHGAPAAPLPEAPPLPFQMGLPALDRFPRTLWSGMVAREARALSEAGLGYPDPAGHPPLRDAIAAYLAVSRGIACTPDQVFVTAGYQGALSLVARVLLRPGDTVWFEDPGYHFARRALAAAGARLVPVPVDDAGLDVAQGIAAAPDARLAVVTPAHQAPLGVALALARRLALLNWAETAGAYIVEDDYDGEFHYAGRPLPALKSLDRGDVVFYAGSFSKTLFPALRLGYLVAPAALCDAVAAAGRNLSQGVARLEQAVAARFLGEGHFTRHLRRMRALYAARRAALAAALRSAFGDRVRLDMQAGGLHLLARFASDASDMALAAAAETQGLAPTPLSLLAVAPVQPGLLRPGLLLGFTNIPAERAPAAAQALYAAIGGLLAVPRSPDSADFIPSAPPRQR